MSPIELHIKPLTLQCESCGRIRTGGPGSDWVRDDSVTPDVVGLCASCGENQHRAAIRKEQKWKRELRQHKPHPVREMTDEDWKDLI